MLLNSCAIHKKQGCGLSETGKNVKYTLASSKMNSNVKISGIIPGYIAPKQSSFRGYGETEIIDTTIYPARYLIRVRGLIKNDIEISTIKYIVVYQGPFARVIKHNLNKMIYFECKAIISPLNPDILDVFDGCLEKSEEFNYIAKDGAIVLRKI